MRYLASEKYEIMQTVERSTLSIKRTLKRLDIRRSTFYGWLKRFVEHYNNKRYHESLDNLTPADLYYGPWRVRLRTESTDQVEHDGPRSQDTCSEPSAITRLDELTYLLAQQA